MRKPCFLQLNHVKGVVSPEPAANNRPSMLPELLRSKKQSAPSSARESTVFTPAEYFVIYSKAELMKQIPDIENAVSSHSRHQYRNRR